MTYVYIYVRCCCGHSPLRYHVAPPARIVYLLPFSTRILRSFCVHTAHVYPTVHLLLLHWLRLVLLRLPTFDFTLDFLRLPFVWITFLVCYLYGCSWLRSTLFVYVYPVVRVLDVTITFPLFVLRSTFTLRLRLPTRLLHLRCCPVTVTGFYVHTRVCLHTLRLLIRSPHRSPHGYRSRHALLPHSTLLLPFCRLVATGSTLYVGVAPVPTFIRFVIFRSTRFTVCRLPARNTPAFLHRGLPA